MKLNKVLIYKIVDNIMTFITTLGFRMRKQNILIRTPIAYTPTVMINVSFLLGMSII
ncbi:MAG: hypothetical protein ACFFCM_18600 [Promethearchaeota archaeon]